MIEPPLQDALRRIAAKPILLVACDFDGTLSPIVPDPSKATADQGSLAALNALAGMESTHVAVVTGRSRRDVANRLVGLRRAVLIGEHGADTLESPPPDPGDVRALKEAMKALGKKFPGTVIEPKGTGVAVHYRHVAVRRHEELLNEVRAEAARLHCGSIREGQFVIETGVFKVTKGDAMRTLTRRCNAQGVLFVGDDITDEDAFSALRPEDVGVRVGGAESVAEFSVQDHQGVRIMLEELGELRRTSLSKRVLTPIDSLAMLSDQRTCALVDAGGRVAWMCAPRFDSAPIFAELLGGAGAGAFEVAPAGDRTVKERRYEPDSFVLTTRYESMTVTDYLDCSGGRAFQRAGRSDLVRVVEGTGRVSIRFSPRSDFGRMPTRLHVNEHGVVVEGTAEPIALRARGVPWQLEEYGRHQSAVAVVELNGAPLVLDLRLGSSSLTDASAEEPSRREATCSFWSGWAGTLRLPSLHADLVRRSALVVKSLCYGPTGAILAAATTSLPEQLGGVRNWDYRYCWVRDAAMSAATLVRLGSTGHAMKFLDWLGGVLEDLDGPERLLPIYTVKGAELGPEGEVPDLRGYGDSLPVRVGNGAAHQVQLDVFGVVADLIAMLAESGAPLTPDHIRMLNAMVQAVERRWQEPDHGIWEVRGPVRHHVHSKAMCWFTVVRTRQALEKLGERIDPKLIALADSIRADVLSRGCALATAHFTGGYEYPQIDAACLLVGLTGLVEPQNPRFLATVEAVEEHLLEGGSVTRYRVEDGLPGSDGGFHLCTGWLIEALHLVGRRDDAHRLLDEFAGQAGPLGLYSEERDQVSGRALGNYPQAYSHLALINACCRLSNG